MWCEPPLHRFTTRPCNTSRAANSVVVPLRLLSCVIVPQRPCFNGRPGWVRALGAPKHFHTGKIASRKSPSMAALSRETTHRTGSEAVAAATGAPARCAAWQSSVGYAARDGPGDPRGWKSAAGPEATNPR